MGNSVSLCFKQGNFKSVVLFDHWGGMDMIGIAKQYVKDLHKEVPDDGTPLGRKDPGTVMVDFVRYITKGSKRVMSSLCLGADEYEGDNTSNGHHEIEL